MRKSVVSFVVLSFLFISQTLNGGQALNVVARGSGATCDEAKLAIHEAVDNGSNAYTSEQEATKQFASIPAATNYCQTVHSATAPAPFLVAPPVNDNAITHDPLKFYDVAVSRTCSFERDSQGNITGYFAVWTGNGACTE